MNLPVNENENMTDSDNELNILSPDVPLSSSDEQNPEENEHSVTYGEISKLNKKRKSKRQRAKETKIKSRLATLRRKIEAEIRDREDHEALDEALSLKHPKHDKRAQDKTEQLKVKHDVYLAHRRLGHPSGETIKLSLIHI